MDAHLLTPTPWMMLPFGLLLAAIALLPLAAGTWWSRHYPAVSFTLGAVTLLYYLLSLHAFGRVLHTATEYFSFIALLASLFVVSGGIHLGVKGEATPLANVCFLAIGAVLANLLGTTGASMLLIRPWLRLNKYRITAHHVVFFIFIVSNVGGGLTPIGDPPLFLGYLRGIPFWWVATHCWPMWLAGVVLLLAAFYLVDRRNYLRAPKAVRERLAEPADQWHVEGLHNLAFLAVILGSVFLKDPPFLREGLMLGAAVGSWFTTRKGIHEANHFNFHPILEVAILFAGIFATMMPALDWLQANAARMGTPSPSLFYWSAGMLSSVLDNAPTYLSFLSTQFGAFASPELVQQVLQHVQAHGGDLTPLAGTDLALVRQTVGALHDYHPAAVAAHSVSAAQVEVAVLLGNPFHRQCLVAISVASVFFGACTYIGNGPNFMVKAIADQQKVNTPTFLGYVVRYTLPWMLPMLILVWWAFFR